MCLVWQIPQLYGIEPRLCLPLDYPTIIINAEVTSSLISFSVWPLFLTISQNANHSSSVISPLLSKSTALKRASVLSFAKFAFQNFRVSALSIDPDLFTSIYWKIPLAFSLNSFDKPYFLTFPPQLPIIIKILYIHFLYCSFLIILYFSSNYDH